MRGDRDGVVSAAAAPGHDGQGGGEWGSKIVEREKVTELGWKGG